VDPARTLASTGRAVASAPPPAGLASGAAGDSGAPVAEAPLEQADEPRRRQQSGAEVPAPEVSGKGNQPSSTPPAGVTALPAPAQPDSSDASDQTGEPQAAPARTADPAPADGNGLHAASPDERERPFLASGELAFAGWLQEALSPQESSAPVGALEHAAQGAPASFEQPASDGHPGDAGGRRVSTFPGQDRGNAPGETARVDGPARSAVSDEPSGAADSAAETVPAEGNNWSAGRESRLAAAALRLPDGDAGSGDGPRRMAATAVESGANQNNPASAPAQPGKANATPADAIGQVAAISASEDGGGATRQAPSPDGSPDPASDSWRKNTAGAASRDEWIANHGSRQPELASRAADEISDGYPAVRVETSGAAPGGGARGQAADRQAPAPPAAPVPEPAPGTPARDILLRLSEGDQRVAVRLVERQGEVHVEVRTPDAGLAGDLRRDLPSLAARLEQSGIRAETWRGEAEGRRPSGSDSPGAEPDANAGQGRRQQGREGREDPPRRSPEAEQQIDPKGKGKEFEWFMSSHR
jgi:hypothetical protein